MRLEILANSIENAKKAPISIVEGRYLLPRAGAAVIIFPADAYKLTGIGRSTLYELIKAGELETVKVGRSTFIRYASLKRLFEKS